MWKHFPLSLSSSPIPIQAAQGCQMADRSKTHCPLSFHVWPGLWAPGQEPFSWRWSVTSHSKGRWGTWTADRRVIKLLWTWIASLLGISKSLWRVGLGAVRAASLERKGLGWVSCCPPLPTWKGAAECYWSKFQGEDLLEVAGTSPSLSWYSLFSDGEGEQKKGWHPAAKPGLPREELMWELERQPASQKRVKGNSLSSWDKGCQVNL